MPPKATPDHADIWLIRHAPAKDGGAMAGRRDVDADCSDQGALAALAAYVALTAQDQLIASPALRCQQTAQALFGAAGLAAQGRTDPRLWEQDFGAWEGVAHADLPDLGPMPQLALAQFAPPQGESFADVVARVAPVLHELPAGRHVIVAHAGVIRAGLGLALGAAHLGLGFAIAAPSLTRLGRNIRTGEWVIQAVNWTAK